MLRRAFIAACLCLALPTLAAEAEFRRILVVPKGDGWACDSEMLIPVPPALAWETMTDFDTMARWVPNLRASRVLKRDGRTVVIEQSGTARFGILSFDFALERRLELDPPRGIAAVQTAGTLKRYQSTLAIAPEKGGTRLTYKVDLEPGFFVAVILSKEFMEHELREQFTAIAAEMMRRDAARGGAAGSGAATGR